jgi:hypothetical protein
LRQPHSCTRGWGRDEAAAALLAEIEANPDTRQNTTYVSRLPALVRTALATGNPALAQRLPTGVESHAPLNEHALTAATAALAETHGDVETAAAGYADAATRWQAFGHVPEHAYALLGQGRCLRGLGDPDAEQPLRLARELFASMRYKPALAETEALLGQAQAATT